MLLQRLDARDAWVLTLLALVFVASRLAWLGLNLESSAYWEESYRLIAARELLRRPILPLLDYQADHYQGGSLVMILLTVSLFRVFGESVLVMKLAALLVSTATLCLLYVVGRRVFGRTTALAAATAYIAGPPVVAYWGLAVMGSHGESILFSLIQFLIFFEIAAGRWRTSWGWAAFGFVSALGLWFCYTTALGLAACAITWVLRERIPRPRELSWALAGALVGLAPWFAYNLTHEFVGLGRIVELFGYGDPIDAWVPQGRVEKLARLVLWDFPVGIVLPFQDDWPLWVAVVLAAGLAIPMGVALGFALRRSVSAFLVAREQRRRSTSRFEAATLPPDLLFMVYGAVFLAFFLGVQFTIDPDLGPVTYRLLLPPTVILALPAAHTLSCALGSGAAGRVVALGGFLLCLAASATGTALLASRAPEQGTDNWLALGQTARGVLLHRKYEREIDRAFSVARRVGDPKWRFSVFQGIGWGMQYRFEGDGDLDRVRRELAVLPPAERLAVLNGLRFFAGESRDSLVRGKAGRNKGERLAARLDELQRFTDEEWRRMMAARRMKE